MSDNVVALDPYRQTGRLPISNVGLEGELLGCVLRHPSLARSLESALQPAHFSEPVHRQAVEAIRALEAAGETPDLFKVLSALGSRLAALEIGGGQTVQAYLGRLTSDAMPAMTAAEYAHDLQCLWGLREIEAAVSSATDGSGFVPSEKLGEVLERADAVRVAFVQRRAHSLSLAEALKRVSERLVAEHKGQKQAVPATGLRQLDYELGGGLHPSKLITIAGRPAMGKSLVGVEIAERAAAQGFGTVYHSLEMDADSVTTRILSSRLERRGARLPWSDIKGDRITPDQFGCVVEQSRDIQALPLRIEDAPSRTIGEIGVASERAMDGFTRQGIPLGAVVIDHMHLVRPSRQFNREDERFKDVADGALALAKRLAVPVLLLAQLNRGVEGREDKRPGLADLRGTGALEEDSDAVIFLYRPAYYTQRQPEYRQGEPEAVALYEATKHHLELIIDKNRAGRSNAIIHAWVDVAVNALRDFQEGRYGAHP